MDEMNMTEAVSAGSAESKKKLKTKELFYELKSGVKAQDRKDVLDYYISLQEKVNA